VSGLLQQLCRKTGLLTARYEHYDKAKKKHAKISTYLAAILKCF